MLLQCLLHIYFHTRVKNQRKHFMIDKTLVYSGAILTVRTKTNLIFKLKESFYCRVVNKREPQFHER